MTDNVIISIKGKQLYAESSPEEMELVTSGTLKRDSAGGYTVSYAESELTGMEGTTTRLHIKGGQVTLLREGSINSQMVFEAGRQHTSLYETPYGELSIDVQTSQLRHTLSERGGLMEIHYSIAVEHTVAGRNSFKIRVRRKH